MTLQSRVQDEDGVQPAQAPTLADPVAYLRRLLSSGRFRKDSGLGRIYHPGSVSLRENAPADSLHIVIHHDHISAHVDKVSPLGEKPGYSFHRAALHNAVGAAQDLVRLLRGRKGDHRSHLDCEWVWDGYEPTPDPAHLLDPSAWSVHLEARVAGILDDARMRKAFDTVVGHRPVDHDPVRVVSCHADEDLDAARDGLLAEPVAVNQWPPLQAVLAHHPEGDVLLLNVNHAAGDGFSAVRVLESIAAAYADAGPPAPALDFLAVNDLPVRPASRPVSVVEGWYRVAVEKVRDALANPARLAPDHPADRPGYGLHFVRLSVADTRRVANVHRQGTARNLLLAALHLAIGEWNLEHGTPGRRIGVLVPVDLRPEDWRHEMVGNFSVTARVSTSRRHRSGARAALKVITAQKTRNKRVRTGVALLAALERNGLLALWAKQSLVVLQPLTRNKEVDTAMLANVGWLDEAPSFGAEAGETTAMWCSLPARAPHSLCVGAVVVGGRLHLTFRYPHRLFDAGAARRFAESYVEHVIAVAERRW
ncbi:MAG TPA: hypothetical protein VM388_05160 [Acidimicrobiales bacterium]|nr:hypothetical protein [Acidimicrobiales bacterium]